VVSTNKIVIMTTDPKGIIGRKMGVVAEEAAQVDEDVEVIDL